MPVRRAWLPAALVVVALVAVALGVTGCAGTASSEASSSRSSVPSSEPPADTSQRIEVSVAGGRASGDTGRVPVAAGTSVTLVVTSDAADEIHVHGYDLTAELVPGQPAEVAFDATTPGVFEVELHEAGRVLLTLQVQ